MRYRRVVDLKLPSDEDIFSDSDSVNNSRLTSLVLIQCDGEPLELPQLEGIAVVNIPSVYGGANLWGETDKKKARKWRAKSGGRGNELDWAVQGEKARRN